MSLFHTAPYFLTPRDGQALMLKEITARVLATSKLTHGAFSLAEVILPDGFATQIHFHLAVDEAVYILQGRLSVLRNGVCIPASAGALIFLPRGVPHRLTVTGRAPATVLCLAVPACLDELAAKYSIEVLGPLPPQKGESPP